MYNKYDEVVDILSQRGYVTVADIPSRDPEAILDEMCEIGWLEQHDERYYPGELAKLRFNEE